MLSWPVSAGYAAANELGAGVAAGRAAAQLHETECKVAWLPRHTIHHVALAGSPMPPASSSTGAGLLRKVKSPSTPLKVMSIPASKGCQQLMSVTGQLQHCCDKGVCVRVALVQLHMLT